MQIELSIDDVNKELPEELRSVAHTVATQLLEAKHRAVVGYGVMCAAWQLYQVGVVLTRSAFEHSPVQECDEDTALRGLMSTAAAAAFAPFDTAQLEHALQTLCLPMLHKLHAKLNGEVVSSLPLTAPDNSVLTKDVPYVMMCADKDALHETLQTHVIAPATRDGRNVFVIAREHTAPRSMRETRLSGEYWDGLWAAASSARITTGLLRLRTTLTHQTIDMIVVEGLPDDCEGNPTKTQAALKRLRQMQRELRCVMIVGVNENVAQWRAANPGAASVVSDKYMLRVIHAARDEQESGTVMACTLQDNWAQFNLPLVRELSEAVTEKVESDNECESSQSSESGN